MAGVRPKEDDVATKGAGNTGTGPQDASTAVGGLTANQDKGGAKSGSTPAPTGGDGASAPSAGASR